MAWIFTRHCALHSLASALCAAFALLSANPAAASLPALVSASVLFATVADSAADAVVAAPISSERVTTADLPQIAYDPRALQDVERGAPGIAAAAAAPLCDAAATACNYQSAMTPVRSQGRCASCWAFAALGAWEGVYALRYGTAIDLSEQQVLVCTGSGNTCSGGFWGDVLALMSSTQIAAESRSPYTGQPGKCHRDARSQYSVASWGYISVASVPPPVDRIKQALAQHGPVIAGIYSTRAFKDYTGGTFSGTDDGPINHAINIVGWDDTRQAWRVRNSAGTAWGEAGYAWVAYGSNRIGAWATWVEPAAPAQPDLFGGAVTFAMAED